MTSPKTDPDGGRFWTRPYRASDDGKILFRGRVLHRVDGPAFEGANGSKIWILHGEFHRDGTPAVDRTVNRANPFDRREWWHNGRFVGFEERP